MKTGISRKLRAAAALLAAVLLLSLWGCGAPVQEHKPTVPEEPWSVSSATWLDPNHIVLQWEHSYSSFYRVYRLNDQQEYELLTETTAGSYLDSDVSYPNEYTYQVERIFVTAETGVMSEPIVSGTNPQKIHAVPVIMYHNFITPEDEANGVEYEEYSIRPEDFAADLQWLQDNGYTTITSRELLHYLSGSWSEMPEKPIILSIDDGTWGVYTNAWPLLKQYGMKADLNVIGANIDETWERLRAGGTRVGHTAPYCTWEELLEMSQSGEINVCSHTYGLHVYDRSGRIGMDLKEGEAIEDYIADIAADYELAKSSIGGWISLDPTTVAYPYSKRHPECDAAILENTGYRMLMGGEGCRGTKGNYFVEGCDISCQIMLMSRPCRMDGYPISSYVMKCVREQESMFADS